MHEWPTHARANSSPTTTTSRSYHAPQSRQQNFQRVADSACVCVFICVCAWQRRGNFNWIYATDLWYVFLRVWIRECEWDRECLYACVCLRECEWGYLCVCVCLDCFTQQFRSKLARTKAKEITWHQWQHQHQAATLQHCICESAQRYHLQLKEQRQMKNFLQFSYHIDFQGKKGRARSLHWTRMSWKLTTCMRGATDKGCTGERRAAGVGWVGWNGNGKGQEQGLWVGNKWSVQARKMVATQGYVSQRSEEQQPR